MKRRPASSRSILAILAAMALAVLFLPRTLAVDVVTDGDMEAAGIAAWPHTDVTGTNSSAKATDQKQSGAQSLKGTSQTGRRTDVEWFNAQNVGTINSTDTVLLSLWWGAQFNASSNAAAGTLYFDVKPAAGTWATAWSLVLTPSTTFQSGTVAGMDISASFTTTDSYDIRLRFVGRTGNDNAASINTWWDDVILDATAGGATTTVGNGTDPGNASRCPGDGAAELDAFTLQTSSGTDTVTAVQVSFAAGTAVGLSLVEITSDDGATVYGSQANPADTQSIALSTNITATTTLTQYKVRVTPKTHAAMPAPPGASYAVTGTVSQITSSNTKSYNDTASATVTVDNASPANASWGTITPGDGQVDLAWTNPGDGDFAQVVILRSTASIADAPTEGTTYTAGNTIGASTVVYAGAGTAFTDTGVTNGTDYWYKIFARDTCVNYATGAETGPHTPQPPGDTTTVGNGTDPTDASRCPGGAAAELDAFTLQTSAGTDTVTAVQVTFAAGTAVGLSLVEITSDDGATVYGSQANPADTQGISLGTSITATTTLTQYKVRVTPKSHANMPAPPGASYAVTGTVSQITSTNAKSYNDTASATVMVDNLSPADPSGFNATPGDGQVDLSWTNPGDADFVEVVILRNTAAITDAPAEGATYVAGNTIGASTVVYVGAGTAFTDTGVSNGISYWYEIFARDTCVNYSPGAAASPVTPGAAAQNGTTVVSNSALVSSCRQITVTGVFTGDDNDTGSMQVEYSPAGGGTWSVSCGAVSGASPRQCLVVDGLSPGASYDIRVTYSDADGVTGTNPETLAGLTLGSCGPDEAAPTVVFLAPRRDTVLGGVDKVKLQVFDEGGLAAADPVQWSVDGGAFSATVTVNGNYNCGAGCAVYELDLDTTGLTNGDHYLTVRATDAAGNVAEPSRAFRVRNLGSVAGGGGLLLRRTHGSQLCQDCHALPTHSSQATSTKYGNWAVECLDCHTPHRTRNIFLIRETLRTPNSNTKNVQFQFDDRAGGTNPGDLPGDNPGRLSFLGDRSGASNAPYDDGICEVCHTRTNHWRNSTSGGDHAHNASTRCLECHGHDVGFVAAGGGDCLGCHGDGMQGPRRAVRADFGRTSHHVGDGGTMGGTLTSFDCVVCHAEGIVNAQGETETDGAYHANQVLDLKSADNITVVYSYDKDAVAASAGAAGNWHSGNSVWRTQTSTALDPFCLTCHDSNGASASFNSTDGGSALNPFGDTIIGNNYDEQDRTRVVDIKAKISGAPPSQGQFARHAIRDQSASVYVAYTGISGGTSIYDAGLFTNMGTDELGNPLWNDTSVMGCADCHTVDGANGSSGNAHGSNSEYLLKDDLGTATLGTGDASGGNYVCYRCHNEQRYQHNGSLGSHTGNASDYINTAGLIGAANRNTGNANLFGITCTSCHGGSSFGAIHGTSEVLGVGQDGGAGTRNAYRFMNGANLRFYDPQGWTGTAVTCYTLSRNTTPDTFGSCTKHDRGQGFTKPLQRPLTY